MNSSTSPLAEHKTWQKLLASAERSVGKNYSFYEAPEPEFCKRLVSEYDGDQEKVYDEVLDLLNQASKQDYATDNAWAILKEGATLLHHLQQNKFVPEDDWEQATDTLWRVLEEFSQGTYSALTQEGGKGKVSRKWKHKKFVLDAILRALYKLPGTPESQLERFFNAKISTYWKAFVLFWIDIWGKYQDAPEPYFAAEDYRSNHKREVYTLICYRLEHFDSEFVSHPNKASEAFKYLVKHREYIPAEKGIRRQLYLALFKYLRESGEQNSLERDLAAICVILGPHYVFRFIAHPGILPLEERGRAWLSFDNLAAVNLDDYDLGEYDLENYDLEGRWKSNKKMKHEILPALIAALKHDQQSVREDAATFLKPHETELFKHLRYIERQDSDEETDGREVFKRIARVYPDEVAAKLLENISFTQQEKGKFLLSTPRILEAHWKDSGFPNHTDLLPVILATVNHKDPEVSAQASAFLKRKSAVLQERLNELINEEDKATELIASAN